MAKIDNSSYNIVWFHFDNGNSIDAIFGYCTYSDNYNRDDISDPIKKFQTFMSSETVEVMFHCSDKLEAEILKRFNQSEQPLARIGINDWFDIANLIKNEEK